MCVKKLIVKVFWCGDKAESESPEYMGSRIPFGITYICGNDCVCMRDTEVLSPVQQLRTEEGSALDG